MRRHCEILVVILLIFEVHTGASISNGCKGVAYRTPGYILVGAAQGVLTVDTIDDCIESCTSSHPRFEFQCLSGVFYYEADNFNCILNSQTRRLRPDLFTLEPHEKVEYFEVQCPPHVITKRQSTRNRNVLQMNTPEFGNWTMCDKELLQHLRFKQCQTLNPNKCEFNANTCEPSKEDEYDRQGGSSSNTTSGGGGGGPTTGEGGGTAQPTTAGLGGETPPPTIGGVDTSQPANGASTTPSITGGGTDETASSVSVQQSRRRPPNGTAGGNRPRPTGGRGFVTRPTRPPRGPDARQTGGSANGAVAVEHGTSTRNKGQAGTVEAPGSAPGNRGMERTRGTEIKTETKKETGRKRPNDRNFQRQDHSLRKEKSQIRRAMVKKRDYRLLGAERTKTVIF